MANQAKTRNADISEVVSTAKGGTGLSASGTSGNVLTSDGSVWTSATPTATITAVTLIPQSAIGSSSPSSNSGGAATVMFVGQVVVPFKIIANKISIYAPAVTTAGTLDLTLYSEDGQTQLFSVTTGTISSAGLFTTALSAVTINPGIYWIAWNSNSTASITASVWSISTIPFAIGGIAGSVASEPVMQGTLSITSGTPPATITPTSITYATTDTLIFRLDN